MPQPLVLHGQLTCGTDLVCGENVVIDVEEEVILGDRCVLANDTYLCGRRIEIGDDFYGYNWDHMAGRLDVGRGRKDEEFAVLQVGHRCTFHNNRIDLAQSVCIGDDVGLSPEVVIYTHGYWLSVLEGYPARFEEVTVGDGVIIGFRSVLLAGCVIGEKTVVGAQSVVCGQLPPRCICAGNPARKLRDVVPCTNRERESLLRHILKDYHQFCEHRKVHIEPSWRYPFVYLDGCSFDVERLVLDGKETPLTDDFRDFLFRRGLRFYTKRPFKKLKKV